MERKAKVAQVEQSQTEVFLYDVKVVIAAGDQVPIDVLQKHQELWMLLLQLMFINGDVEFKDFIHQLEAWIKVGVEPMSAVFNAIYSQRGIHPT